MMKSRFFLLQGSRMELLSSVFLLLALCFSEVSSALPEGQSNAHVSGSLCGRDLPDLAPKSDTVFVWLPSGIKSLPDVRQLRSGDGLVIKAHSAKEGLAGIKALHQQIILQGMEPLQYKYILRTFPADLVPNPSAEVASIPFFSDASAEELAELRKLAFAIMFDHERVWYDRSPDRLPSWTWDYSWTLKQVKSIADSITAHCIPAGVLVTPSSKREGKWTEANGSLMKNGFAKLLDTPVTGLNYLIVQAQPRCREDDSGFEYGDFARQLRTELEAVFPGDTSIGNNLVMQVSIDDHVHPKKGANYVPPKWTVTCLNATALDNFTDKKASTKSVNGFFFWSGSRKATCEALNLFRGPSGSSCQ